MSGDFPDPHFKCPNCGQMIDPETCWCGQPIDHGYDSTHAVAIPMGCDCYRDKGDDDLPFDLSTATLTMN